MRRTAARIGTLVAAAALAACGPDDARVELRESGPVAPRNGTVQRPRAADAAKPAPAPPALSVAEIGALLAAWENPEGEDTEAVRREAHDRLVAGGRPVAERLVALLGEDKLSSEATALIPMLEADAVAPLLAALPTSTGEARNVILTVLDRLAHVWQDDAQGPAVCRALLPLLAGADEEAAYAAKSALESGGAAARTVAKDLAEMWLHGTPEASERALGVLLELGADAAPAAPLAVAELIAAATAKPAADPDNPDDETGSDGFERAEDAHYVLTAIGSADPSILPSLRKLLAPDGNPVACALAVEVLAEWGDAGAAAAPELIALLRDPSGDPDALADIGLDEVVRDAAHALTAMPSAEDAVWAAIRKAYASGARWPCDESVIAAFASPGLSSRFILLMPTLPPDARAAIVSGLQAGTSRDFVPVAAALLRHPDADARIVGLEPWTDEDEKRPMPDGAAKLLDDPDASVRGHAAWVFAIHGGVPAAKIRDAALALVRPVAEDVTDDARIAAIRALGRLPAGDRAVTDAIVGVLDGNGSDELRAAAALELSAEDASIEGEHAAAVAWLESHLLGGPLIDEEHAARALLRFHGGAEALTATVGKLLGDEKQEHLYTCADIIWVAGPRAAALRPALTAMRETTKDNARHAVGRALAAIDADPEAIATTAYRSDEVVRRLLSLGEPGRAALVVLVGFHGLGRDTIATLDGVPMADAVLASARATAPDPLVHRRHLGAAQLAQVLAPAQAVEVLTILVDGRTAADPPTAAHATGEALADLASRSPGAVPIALVERLLAVEFAAATAARAAGALGPRGLPLAPALRRLRDGAREHESLAAAVALWQVTGSADEALPTIRGLLRTMDLESDEYGSGLWTAAAPVIGRMPLGEPDLAALLAAIRRGFPASLVPLLERFGAGAAPAVATLRRIVSARDCEAGTRVETAEPAIRVLGAIGGAARDALPDIRRWSAELGDPHGVAREAIRRIESAPK